MKSNKRLIYLCITIAITIISILVFFSLKQVNEKELIAERPNLYKQQTTVPDGYTGIYTAEDFVSIANDLTADYILMADIDMTDQTYEVIAQTSSTPFKGTLEGNYYKISNLTISSANANVGLFGYVNGGIIQNLTLENINVTGTLSGTTYIGGVAGYFLGSAALIDNVKITGESVIQDSAEATTSYVGGLVGYKTTGKITNNSVEGTIKGISKTGTSATTYLGGISGFNSSGTIQTNSCNATIEANDSKTMYVGGLVANFTAGTLTATHFTGTLEVNTTGTTVYVGGGFANSAGGTINTTYSTGTINANITATNAYVGGLIGYNSSGTLTTIYATGIMNLNTGATTTYAGGLIGYVKGAASANRTISKVYSTAKINIESTGKAYLGGLIGYIVRGGTSTSYYVTVTNSYAISDISGTCSGTVAQIGGLVGYSAYGKLTYTYAAGKIDVTTSLETIGGLVGVVSATTSTSSYWAPEIAGVDLGTIGDNRRFQEMLYQTTYTSWNFSTIWAIDADGQSLPYLIDVTKPDAVLESNFEYEKSSGSGTEEDPFLIDTAAKLQNLKRTTGKGNYYKIINDIDLSSISNFEVIAPTSTLPFQGSLDGRNYTVSNLNMNSEEDYSGMFGYISAGSISNLKISNVNIESSGSRVGVIGYIINGTVSNVTLTDINIKGTISGNVYIGGLIGQTNTATIDNVKLTGEGIIQDSETGNTEYIGGIIGHSSGGTITNCSTEGTVKASTTSTTGTGYIGGLVGYVSSSTLTSCNSSATIENTISKNSYTGGLVGYSTNETFSNIYTTGTINVTTTSNAYVGGIIGSAPISTTASKTMNKMYSTATINVDIAGTARVGGLIGYSARLSSSSTYIMTANNVYSLANITGTCSGTTANIGGLIGESGYVNVNYAYAAGKINVTTSVDTIGGLVGKKTGGTWTSTYWSIETTGIDVGVTGENKTFQEMLYSNTYENWDFDTIWAIDAEGQSLPYLIDLEKPNLVLESNYEYVKYSGDGTESNPFIIDTAAKLQNLKGTTGKGCYYKIVNDIDLSSIDNFETIAPTNTLPFQGHLDGGNYTISNLNMVSEETYSGLFGYISAGSIKDLKVSNANIEASGTHVGLVGYITTGTISNIEINNINLKGTIDGDLNIGGLTGFATQTTIDNVSITGDSVIQDSEAVDSIYMGGLAARVTSSTVTNSNTEGTLKVSTTSTTDSIYVGGLIGNSSSTTITSCNSNTTIDVNISKGGYVGGLTARTSTDTISNSYTTGIINVTATGTIYVGGFIGYIPVSTSVDMSISKVYSTKTINLNTTGTTYAGGLIGNTVRSSTDTTNYYYINIDNAYSLSTISGTCTGDTVVLGSLIGQAGYIKLNNTYAVGKIDVETTSGTIGGLTGKSSGSTAVSSYWSMETTGADTSTIGESRRFQEMLYQSTYTDWDFDTIWAIDGNEQSLPYLRDLPKADLVLESNYEYAKCLGDGTEENPFLIDTADKLQSLRATTGEGRYYKIINDIDLSSISNFKDIGTADLPFKGNLDGGNYTVSNLNNAWTYTTAITSRAGMFGYIEGAIIKNLTISNANITAEATSSYLYVGLIGYMKGGTVSNVTLNDINVKGVISGSLYIGGLMGHASGQVTVDNVNLTGNSVIEDSEDVGNFYIGGLIGHASGITITNCSTEGTIKAISTREASTGTSSNNGSIAGIVGTIGSSEITNCHSSATIESSLNKSTYVGGIAGRPSTTTISNTYSTGIINVNNTGYVVVGGIAGYTASSTTEDITFSKVYSTKTINLNTTGDTYVGGLIGNVVRTTDSTYFIVMENAYTIANILGTCTGETVVIGGIFGKADYAKLNYAYAAGKIDVETSSTTVGGLAGKRTGGTCVSSYWPSETVGIYTSVIGESRRFQEMLYQNTYIDWDFDTVWAIDGDEQSLPYLRDLPKTDLVLETNYEYPKCSGTGTQEDPFLIDTADKLQSLKSTTGEGRYYTIVNDIDLGNIDNFGIIGSEAMSFKGNLDGGNYTVSNINIDSEDEYSGMFGYVIGGSISDLVINNINVKGTASTTTAYMGLLAGYIEDTTIDNVKLTGDLEDSTTATTMYLGGLVGYVLNGNVANSSADGKITTSTTSTTGKEYIGGLIGYTSETNVQSSNSSVSLENSARETNYIGGLIGYSSNGTVLSCTTQQNIEVGTEVTTGAGYIGGLIGYTTGTSVQDSNSDTSIENNLMKTNYTGGLLGYIITSTSANLDVSKVYSTGEIILNATGSSYVGGLIGYGCGRYVSSSTTTYYLILTNVFSTVDIVGKYQDQTINIGTLIGYTTYSELNYGYAAGVINIGTISSGAGGLVGVSDSSTCTSSYWSPEATGQETSALGTSVEFKNMLYQTTYSDWDFDTVWAIEPDGASLPYFKNNKPNAVNKSNYFDAEEYQGDGTEENPYIIDTIEKLAKINLVQTEKYFKIAKDLDGSEIENYKDLLVDRKLSFVGYLDGKNCTISNLNIESSDEKTGVIETNEGTIKNLVFDNLTITTTNTEKESYAGVVAYNAGDIDNVNVNGKINATGSASDTYIGQIAGYSSGDITNNIVSGTVSNTGTATNLYMGQVAGYNLSNISDSEINGTTSNIGEVTNLYMGQITGYNSGLIQTAEVYGSIDNIGLISNMYVGQITGYNNYKVCRTYSNGTINNTGTVSNAYIGGTAGYNASSIKIASNKGKIIAKNIENLKIGGITGESINTINNSYSKGTIELEEISSVTLGGIAGENSGEIKKTYSTETITVTADTIVTGAIAGNNTGTIEDSYWNIENVAEADGNGTLKTIDELKQQATYEGWNFDDVWQIEEGVDTPTFGPEMCYYDDGFWEWHTRTTTDDKAYNGIHIEIDDTAHFYGYWQTSYKDYLYKYYDYAGEKIFRFAIDETKASYHTLDGVGFIFNASKEDDILSGYVLAIEETTINIYRLDNIDAVAFETTASTTLATYAGDPLISVEKTVSDVHNLEITTSPTNVTVVDNEVEIINLDLDYSTHSGEDFGLLASYAQHACSILTEIEFTEFQLVVDDYSIPITKRDNHGNLVSGATFQVLDSTGSVVREGQSDSEGIFEIVGLQAGTYTLKEVEAPAGYVLDSNEYVFTMNEDGTATFENEFNSTIYNEIVKAEHVIITKYKEGTTTPVPGAVIGLFDASGNAINDTEGNQLKLTTDTNGQVDFTNIEVGTYQYKELETPAGYILNDTMYEFTVNKDGSVTFASNNGIIYNGTIKAEHVIITKYEEGTTTPLSGAVIGLFDANGNAINDTNGNQITVTTNSEGQADFTNIEVGTYQYKEIEAPTGYALNDTMYEFTVNDDGTVTFGDNQGIIYNAIVKAEHVVITKYLEGTTMPIAGAVIGLFDADGEAILDSEGNQITLTTNERGQADFEDLTIGTYQYKELQAPEGYILNETMYEFTVNNDGSVTFGSNDGIIYNEKIVVYGNVTIIKYKTGTETPIAGAVIGLFDAEGNAINDTEGNQITLTTDTEGKIEFTNIEEGSYKYKELQAPAGYVLNDTMYEFTVNNDGTVTFGDNNGIIYNDRVKATSIIITKYKTGTETPVFGAVIGLFDANGEAILDSEEAQITLTTDENGQINFGSLEVGTYKYKELTAPAGYVLNDTMYEFTVNDDGTVTYGENNGIIYNDRVKATSIVITKYKTGTETPVSGAVIGLFDSEGNAINDTEGNQVTLTTDENGKIDFGSLEVGTYKYKELTAPAGYVLNDTIYEFTVNDDGTVTYGENNGIIYNDRVKSTSIVVTKYKTGTETPVAGAVIGLFDANGEAILDSEEAQITLTTDENGKIDFGSLEVGTYKYKELQAPSGYVLNDTMYEFTVNDDGTVTFGENNGIIYNDRVKATSIVITKYKTGTETPISGAVIGLFDSEENEIKDTDGNQVTLTTNAEGKIDFGSLEVGTYKYKELTAPAGYVLNDTMYEFTVNDDGTVTYGENNGIIYNDRVKSTSIVITKYKTGTETPVSGAVIGLFDANGEAILDSEEAQITLTTNAEGKIDFGSLEVGTYKYKELTAPAGYVLNDTMYEFTVNNDGTVTFGENNGIIYNDRVKSTSIVITKYKTGTETPVSSAVIGLFNADEEAILDSEGNQVTLTTNTEGKVSFTNIEVGTYKYKELQAPAGYVLNDTMYEFTVNDDGTVTFGENNGIIYNDRVKATSIVITKYKTGTETPISGAVIGLFDANGEAILDSEEAQITLTTNAEGKIDFGSLEVGTYKYKELIAPAGYVLNDTMYEFTVNNDGTVTFGENNGIIYNDRVKATSIVITKYKTGTETPVSGAVIGLFDANGEGILDSEEAQVTLTTDENGKIDFGSLEVGTYKYKELQAPAGYVLNDTMYEFTVNNDGTVTFGDNNGIIYNDRVKATSIVITKYKTGTETPVSGAVIGLFDVDGEAILDSEGNQVTLTTDTEGKVSFTNIEVGTYKYKELQAPSGYVLNDTMYEFTVNDDGTVTFGDNNGVIYNDRVKSTSIVITKYKTGTETPISGAVIGLFDSEENAINDTEGNQVTLTTDENGKIDFGSLEVGTYKYKELQAPSGYVLNDTMYEFTVNDDGTVTFGENNGIIYNDRVKSTSVVITKYKTGTETPVSGAVIGLFDSEENAINDTEGNQVTLTTDENGKIDFGSLEVGTYKYKELQAPSGYVLNNTMYEFTVNNDGTVTFGENNGIIYNDRVKSTSIVITKYKTGTETPISGAVIGLFDVDGEAILDSEEAQVTLTTDENGKIDFGSLEVGTYKYKELQAPSGYVLNDTMYEFTVNDDGTVTFGDNNGIIYNELMKADNVIIIKYKEGTTIPVSGAVIGLFDESENAINDTEGNQITLTTDENGKIYFTNLEIGTYKYKELTAPSGYVLNDTMYEFTVNDDGTVTFGDNNGIIYNERVKAQHIVITKFIEGTETPLSGAVIGLFDSEENEIKDTDGNQITLTTDENGKVDFTNLEVGTYKYKELTAPTGYVLNDTMYEFTVNDDGTVTYGDNNGIIYNEKEKVYGAVTIRKYIQGTTTPLSGAIIGIYDSAGNPLTDSDNNEARLTTDENGEIKFAILPGTYQYKELQAPTGYILNDTMYKFTVDEDGTVVFESNEGIIYNERMKAEHVVITKYLEGTTMPIAGAVIGLFDTNGNVITGTDGEQITLTTNERGQVDFKDLEVGTYKYRELEAPSGYVLNDTMYEFTVNEDGTVTFGSNEGIIYNEKVKIYVEVIIRKQEQGTEVALQGAIIGLFDSEGNAITGTNGEEIEFTTDSNGEIKFSILPGTYKYKELQAPEGYILNDTMYEFTVNEDETVIFESNDGIIYNEKVKADSIGIIKYIEGTRTPVEGAIIGLFDSEGNAINDTEGNQVTLTTDAQGRIYFKNLEVGTYKYKELEAPIGYILNDTMYEFTVNEDGTVTFGENLGIIYNERVKAEHIIITKYLEGTEVPITGAVIGLFDESGNVVKGTDGNQITLITDENGKVDFTNIAVGTYKYRELEAPTGYILNDTMYEFTVNEDGTVTFGENQGIIYNEKAPIYGQVTIRKFEQGTEKALQGAIIGLFDSEGNAITGTNGEEVEFTTDLNGEIKFSILPGTYKYKELQAPEGYVLNDTMYEFTVNEDGTVTFGNNNGIIYNEKVKIYGDVIIRKFEQGTERPLQGAVIGLFDSEGNAITGTNGEEVEFTTDLNGEISFRILQGTYKYKELQAPEGYVLNDTMYEFTVNDDGTVTFGNNNGIIYNEKVKIYGDVIIRKFEQGTEKALQGAVIGLFDSEGNSITGTNGEEVEFTTDANGEIKFSILPGVYKYKELQAPSGYILDDTMYTFTVSEDGTVTFIDNNGIIYNTRVTSDRIVITKYIKDTRIPVQGAVIALFDANGNAIIGVDEKPIELTTNEDGQIYFQNLEIGTYKYKEIQAPEGYILNDTMYEFMVNEDGTVTFGNNNGIIYNERIYGEVIIKKFEQGTQTGLLGAVIGLFDINGNIVTGTDEQPIELTTDANGEIKFKVLPGTYKYKELQAPEGYILNDTMYEFTVNSDGTVVFGENNGIIYNSKKEIKDPVEDNKEPIQNDTIIDNISPGVLPQTGMGVNIIFIIIIMTTGTMCIYFGIKYIKNKNS